MAESSGMELNIDKFIHERARLMVLAYLASSEEKSVTFNKLKSMLDMTAGNLSVQLRNLEDAGYVSIDKKIEKRKVVTSVSLTQKGYEEFMEYIDNMEKIIRSIKE